MTTLRHAVTSFWNDEEGATAIEYGLLAALIALAIIVGATALGNQLNLLFNRIATCLQNTKSCNWTG
ncbi:MAG: Flp family type IVb pilin [Betaproteobacteria bacterium]|nr:MAG: Flp family type IVb pilin [Betaproteobacteria bacterium]